MREKCISTEYRAGNRVKKALEKKLEKLIHDNGKIKDTSLNFEQLGFDSIVVDEAHNYKNASYSPVQQRPINF